MSVDIFKEKASAAYRGEDLGPMTATLRASLVKVNEAAVHVRQRSIANGTPRGKGDHEANSAGRDIAAAESMHETARRTAVQSASPLALGLAARLIAFSEQAATGNARVELLPLLAELGDRMVEIAPTVGTEPARKVIVAIGDICERQTTARMGRG